MSVTTLSVKCPTCQSSVTMTEEFPHRPFCSKRCQLIDLGEWASEGHKVPGNELEDENWSESLDR